MKILCLHGYTQNGSLFARKVGALRRILAKSGYETVFIDAPYQVDQSELSYQTEDNKDMRSWFGFTENKPEYFNLTKAFETVKQAVKEHGPFDGLIGFSQGAGLCGVLASCWNELMPEEPPLKFAILFAGFRLKADSCQHYYKNLIEVPTLHVIGSQDSIVTEERSTQILECCDPSKRTQLQHPGGHFVPSKKEYIEGVVAFIKAIESAKPDEGHEQAPPADDDWDAFDAIGRG